MEAVCLDTHPHILLADDDDALRELLDFALTRAGYLVSCCTNGRDLFDRLEEGDPFDLIISDLRMPALSGLEVLESQLKKQKRAPFICMTAFGDRQTHDQALHFGAAMTIDKPFDLDEMIELVNATSLRKPQPTQPLRSRS
ncbi:MAG: response regulator [Deltaproteobacteria bacterium]|jgi:DNA-binding NtrC family response regulator|nr:response regulator [Deltaproteobacteria bacterium]MCW8893932.1 response regulator [Deltaproteobacteria bacterium]MCW9049128.1 response regulator [Deltaproteobacteria bacterium]